MGKSSKDDGECLPHLLLQRDSSSRFQCFLVVFLVVPIVDVPVVPDVVVAVVPVVDVALVFVIIVPEVSVEVPAGMVEVMVEPVVPEVSVAMVDIVPVVSVDIVLLLAEVSVMVVALVSVLFAVDSRLHAKPNSATAAMVRKTRIVFFIFIPFISLRSKSNAPLREARLVT